ncbi:dolichyl pyrophosphate Man9GlcNAc2 alpha-1,3-glucosyltransferase-like [Artemia franciscana]
METCIILLAITLRWIVAFHSYSGEGKPPMFGDFEAQRHWMEITYNTPVQEWYQNTTTNDLMYWGLDYPPLTAYHSYVCGYIASMINPKYVELFTSRGLETLDHKLFMRLTVLVVDVLVFISGIYAFYRSLRKKYKKIEFLTVILLYPGLILIDYGHFQYNCVSLGFFVWSVYYLRLQKLVSASIFFVLALNYKQMELYHAYPIFWFILKRVQLANHNFGKCINLAKVSITVIFIFIVIWSPFIGDWNLLIQVVHRIFPIHRGVFEDKVANFWCALSPFIKFHLIFEKNQLARVCILITALSALGTCLYLYLKPTLKNLHISLINCSFIFFLFSYHVHEKSILLVAIPVALYLPSDPFTCFWFLLISVFSMLSLYIKDDLFIPYCSLFLSYFMLGEIIELQSSSQKNVRKKVRCLYYLSIFGCFALSIIHKFVEAPLLYPDLWSLGVAFYSFVHFVGFLAYFHFRQFSILDYLI